MTTQNKNEMINFSICMAAVILIMVINWMIPIVPDKKSNSSNLLAPVIKINTFPKFMLTVPFYMLDFGLPNTNPFPNHSEIKGVTGCIGITSKFGDE